MTVSCVSPRPLMHPLWSRPLQHLVQLHAWLQEQKKELEVADSPSETQLQLEIMERQYNQLCYRHKTLLVQGRDTNKQVGDLDQAMFNGATPGKKGGEQLEGAMVKLESTRETLEREATPRLRQLRERLQYHSLDQKAQEVGVAGAHSSLSKLPCLVAPCSLFPLLYIRQLNAGLTNVSSSISRFSGIGHTLKAAQALQESARETSEQLDVSFPSWKLDSDNRFGVVPGVVPSGKG